MDHRRFSISHGFSLLELLLVLGIVGILAGIALPAYQTHLARSARTEAMVQLQDLASRQESHFLQYNRFSDNLKQLGFRPSESSRNAYRIDISLDTASGYVLSAVLNNEKIADDHCGTLTLNGMGIQGANGQTGNDPDVERCWR